MRPDPTNLQVHPNCHPSGRQSQLALDLALDAEGRAGALTASRGAGPALRYKSL
jgi:hypothetical protein